MQAQEGEGDAWMHKGVGAGRVKAQQHIYSVGNAGGRVGRAPLQLACLC